MTANPEWEEIQRELLPGQTSYDRPDLVSRVFQLKKKELLKDIQKVGIFGHAVAYVYTIEFQKRGLPHIHLLIILRHPHKLLTLEDVDSCISAKWPNPVTEPLLFETVQKCMVHGPCGAHDSQACCMEKGRCTKYYPKSFQQFTTFDDDGYPNYARPDDGHAYEVRGQMVDNRWIVPYSPYLSAKFNCHINVECASNIRSIKYPFKYIHKGGDRATLEVDLDEICRFLDGRYLGPPEAIWRIYHFDMHAQKPSVVCLPVHLPGQHLTKFDPKEDPRIALNRAKKESTTLTAWFTANAADGASGSLARSLTYQEFPQHFVLKFRTGFSIGRMYFVSPNGGERFYLRTLLTIAKSATSFQDLRTYNGVEYSTFHEVCLARGLLENDGEWRRCLAEACEIQTGSQLRQLFATLLQFCSPSQPELLWMEFRDNLCERLHQSLTRMGHQNPSEEVHDYGLYLLNNTLMQTGHTLLDYPNMPLPMRDWSRERDNPLIAQQLDYNTDAEREQALAHIPMLNTEQRSAFDDIIRSVEDNHGQTFFLYGPGGTGKTFIYRTVCHHLRSQSKVVLCSASSGIAALLLPGGRTAHSLFKIPIDGLCEDSVCNIPKEGALADLLRTTDLIIWDEALMQNRLTHECLDKTLRDLRDSDSPFGGITVVFGGDPQQILPVIPRGREEEILEASLQRDEEGFAHWLLDVGHGRTTDESSSDIPFPSQMRVQSEDNLINFVYPNLDGPSHPSRYFTDRIILAARNHDVDDINNNILNRMPGEATICYSADTIVTEAGADDHSSLNNAIPTEHLRSLNSSGLPPGELHLKVGCPLILLRNLSPAEGLCNGTRLLLRRISPRVLEASILGGEHDGEVVFIPRIKLTPSAKNTEYSFVIQRLQFPVRLAFAISINKAQGQSVVHVGLDLRIPVFSHGQLYVAFSRATSCHRIKVLLPPSAISPITKNIVYPQALID
ncbi:hypothetical protein D9758_014620 [Tetrapyrgos nigripes]|uniref:ATP-dependent DNA helicase n=1 Tax=Tetrapyrgos nigripes TaxID=182062 RepID=A0A8H5FUQ7_9AGAR|nr:hypothetical protein D9758_014620 [Tetrapyrgos nigripes]